ncbi:hypothetical protein OEA41_003418 [Lepraria neglecta]|uniref:Uncharacterized protein n=1 Tax=Lepraria neglecta TaxID=209136 RepID=A0AAD9Z4I7_9LECA|nr:hypothetical protein OEA41_003418 [Lepraria neglecta]
MHRLSLVAVLLALSTLSIAAPAAKPLADVGIVSNSAKRTVDETEVCEPSIEKATKAKRTVDTAELVYSEIEKAGNAKCAVDGAFIIIPIEKATKDKRTVDASKSIQENS